VLDVLALPVFFFALLRWAMIIPEILSYVLCEMIFLLTRSFFAWYGRSSMIFWAVASSMPGKLASFSLPAVLMSMRSADALDWALEADWLPGLAALAEDDFPDVVVWARHRPENNSRININRSARNAKFCCFILVSFKTAVHNLLTGAITILQQTRQGVPVKIAL
jgi:hypothetical protein